MDKETENIIWQKKHPELKLSYNLDYALNSFWILPSHGENVFGLPFYVQEIGFTQAQKSYYVSRENLQSFWICYITDGMGVIDYNGCCTQVEPGHCVWIDCNRPHKFYTDKETGHLSTFYIHFYGAGAKQYNQHFCYLENTGCVFIGDAEPVLAFIKKLVELYEQKDYTPMTDIEASYLLTVICYNILKVTDVKKTPAMPDLIHRIKRYIEAHYKEGINLDTLANEFYVSKYYLQRQFKKHLKISPVQYLTRVRIANAKKLLRITSVPISRIAYDTGFNDPSYFIRVFRNSEKVTPLAYRHNWRLN